MVNETQSFVNWLRRRNPKARTWKDYRSVLKRFTETVGDKPPSDVSIKDIDSFVVALVEQGLQASTINRHLAVVISFYTYLEGDYPHIVCPVRVKRHFLRKPARLPRAVPVPALLRFFMAIEESCPDAGQRQRDKAMFLLMLRCGLRIAEVAQLKLQDLFLEESRPRIRVFGKNSKERIVYLSPQANEALAVYLDERTHAACDFVFLSYQERGLSPTAIHKRLMRYRELADVHFTAHQLRHSFANDLVDADVPITTVQKLMGHAWLATTQLYLAANDRKVQADFYQAAEALDSWQTRSEAEGVS